MDGEGSNAVQGTNTGHHRSQPRRLALLHDKRAAALRGGMAELLRYQPGLSRDTANGPMAAAAGAHVLLETVEARPWTAAQPHPLGHPPGGGLQSHAQS